jgi:hypothetical protein
MNTELKNFKNGIIGREGQSWSATLFVDGKKVAEVFEQADGGPMRYQPFPNMKSELEKVEAYAKTLPNMPSEYFEEGLPMDLDLLVSSLATQTEVEKKMKRYEKNHIIIGKDRKSDFAVIKIGGGYTIPFLLSSEKGTELLKNFVAKISADLKDGEKIQNTNLNSILKSL